MLSRAEERLLHNLRRRKIRETERLFVAEGVRVAEDLAASSVPLRLAVVSHSVESIPRGRTLVDALENRCPVRRVDESTLTDLANTETPQGVLVVAEMPRHSLADVAPAETATVLVLDAIQDPGNLGTLVRTAEALGAAFVAVLPGTVDPWNPKAVRSAAGASFRVPIVHAEPDELVAWAHHHEVAVYGAEADGDPVDRVELARRAALVVGNEGAGLGPAMRRAVDRTLAVPIAGGAESLNVAVAAGILLFLLTRNR